MRTRPIALVTLALLLAAWTGPAVALDLDDDDKQWLEQVRPLITSDEQRIYKELDSKADRQEFQKIFWARRDPDLSTPENEYKPEFEAAVAQADEEFRVPGKKGSETDCGRIFILLGEPDDKQVSPGSVSVLARTPETWIYKADGDEKESRIALDGSCNAPRGSSGQLDLMAADKVVQPQIDYKEDADGNFVSLEDQLPKKSPARALLDAPRQDFEMTADTRFLRAEGDETGVIGVVHGTVPDLATRDHDGRKVADVVVATSTLDGEGAEVIWTEQPVRAEVLDDGSFVATYGTTLDPGRYTFRVGVVIGEDGPQGSVVEEKIKVPAFSKAQEAPDGTSKTLPTVASVLFVKDIQEMDGDAEADPESAYAAYRLGATQLVPHVGRELQPTDQVVFFYVIYDLGVDPTNEKANAKVAFSILKNGRTPVAKAPEVPIETAMMASTVGPVPLEAYPPGKYVVQLKVTDSVTNKVVVQNEKFTIVDPEAAAQ